MDNFVIRKNPTPKSTKPPLNIYTDGACSNNGKPSARAGFGVWFGENDERNESKKDEIDKRWRNYERKFGWTFYSFALISFIF